jgi:hypothetical protein
MANKDNVAVGKPKVGGAIHVAPSGTTLPTDATTALDAAFVNLGYVSEEGLTNSNSAAVETIHAWGKDIIFSKDGDNETYSWTLLEVLDANVQKFIRGADNVTVAEGGAMSVQVKRPSERSQMEEHAIVVEMILRNRAVRHVIPRGVITELGEVNYTDDDTVGYQVTVTALADANGNSHYEYTAAPAASSNSGSGSGSGSGG